MPSRKKKIPRFKSEDAERAFWDKHSPLDYLGKAGAKKTVLPNLKPSTEVISLRLPSGMLSDIKMLANRSDVPYQSLMKMLLAEKIKENLGVAKKIA